jgi:hypothetical protein
MRPVATATLPISARVIGEQSRRSRRVPPDKSLHRRLLDVPTLPALGRSGMCRRRTTLDAGHGLASECADQHGRTRSRHALPAPRMSIPSNARSSELRRSRSDTGQRPVDFKHRRRGPAHRGQPSAYAPADEVLWVNRSGPPAIGPTRSHATGDPEHPRRRFVYFHSDRCTTARPTAIWRSL